MFKSPTLGIIKESKQLKWLPVRQFNVYQIITAFILPSAIATGLFHVVLPGMVSAGMVAVVAWPLAAGGGLLIFVLFALWALRKESREIKVSLAERMLLKKLSTRQWIIYSGILLAGMVLTMATYPIIDPFMKMTGLTVPSYFPFWLNPGIDPYAVDPELLTPGFSLKGAYWMIPLIGLILLLNILAEEFYFRAWLLPKMSQYGDWAWIMNGAFFAFYHIFQAWLMPVIMVNSLIMAFVVYQSRSIWPALIIHLTLNFFAAGLSIVLLVMGV